MFAYKYFCIRNIQSALNEWNVIWAMLALFLDIMTHTKNSFNEYYDMNAFLSRNNHVEYS